ncbi:hypothetical protein BC628DRAFT_1415653 [Trametes gibbosa]|nr:hypothetical protein BC628DRAFT_1415653 [Trametes gibbosa]
MSHAEDSTQFGYEDHFTPARTRKKRKNRPFAAPPSPAVLLDKVSEELAQSEWLREAQKSLSESLKEAFPASDAAPDVLCLGLGSPASSRDARAQLAFLLAACDDLSIDRSKVSVYDPVFVEDDMRLFSQLGVTPLPENRRASYGLRSPTIAFMPHCDLYLYENLLRENWSRARLPNVLLIANRLSEYAESIPARKLASEHPCVARLVPHLTSRPLQPCTAFPTAFNNTAIQFVPPGRLAARDADWWTLPGAPPDKATIEDLEDDLEDGKARSSSLGARAPAAPADAVAAAAAARVVRPRTRSSTAAAAGEVCCSGRRAGASDAAAASSSSSPSPSPSPRTGSRGSPGPDPGDEERGGLQSGRG